VHRLNGTALSDGSRLICPTPRGPNELRLNMWVAVRGHVYRITNLRAVGTGRLVELAGREPVFLRAGGTLTGFDVAPPVPDDSPEVPPPRNRPGRKRAAPGAGPNSPGRT
jgi:hypothetical protein